MRVASLIAAVILLALAVLALVPAAAPIHAQLPIASAAVAGLLLVLLLAGGGKKEPPPPVAEAARPVALAANRADAEVVNFLALLQDKGRFIDFLMDEISGYGDAQVGAAARVVHEGCKAALKAHFGISPVREEGEGSHISVPAGYAADEYRFVGQIRGEAPFAGTLVHRGWKATRVELPRLVRSEGERLPTIAPAEVKLK